MGIKYTWSMKNQKFWGKNFRKKWFIKNHKFWKKIRILSPVPLDIEGLDPFKISGSYQSNEKIDSNYYFFFYLAF